MRAAAAAIVHTNSFLSCNDGSGYHTPDGDGYRTNIGSNSNSNCSSRNSSSTDSICGDSDKSYEVNSINPFDGRHNNEIFTLPQIEIERNTPQV